MTRKLFSLALMLVMAVGMYAALVAPDAEAAVHIQKKCREGCVDAYANGDYMCFYAGCDNPNRCYYNCFPFDWR